MIDLGARSEAISCKRLSDFDRCHKNDRTNRQGAASRRMKFGTNAVVVAALAIGVVVMLQIMAYALPIRWDMTQSGVNSLTEGTENLLRNVDTNVTLTSLYALVDIDTEMGPTRFVPGSHLSGGLPDDDREYYEISPELERGSAVVFDGRDVGREHLVVRGRLAPAL